MEFNPVEEEKQRSQLVAFWNSGMRSVPRISKDVEILSRRMHSNPEVARFHIGLIKEIADELLQVEKAQLALVDCYRRGHGVVQNGKLAAHYLERAVASGSHLSRWFYAGYLVNNAGFDGFLARDTERALTIYRDLATDPTNSDTLTLARSDAVSLLIADSQPGQVDEKDHQLIRDYIADRPYFRSAHFYDLALFYTRGVASTNYGGAEFQTARNLLIQGMKECRSVEVREKCTALLNGWGVLPQPPQPMTGKEKLAAGADVAAGVGGFVIGQFFWVAAAAAFFAVTAWINAFISIPLILIIGLVALFGGSRRDRRSE